MSQNTEVSFGCVGCLFQTLAMIIIVYLLFNLDKVFAFIDNLLSV